MPPVQAVSVAVIMSVASGIQGLILVRHSIKDQPKRLLRFLLPALFGIPLGVAVLSNMDPLLLKITIAGFLILYGGFFILRKNLPKFIHPTPIADGIVGFLGGFLGGAASLSGALPTMWCSMRPWRKSETRAVLQPFNVATLGLTAVLLGIKGQYTSETLVLIAVALPITLAFAQIGIAAFKRLEDDQFRRLIIKIMLNNRLISIC